MAKEATQFKGKVKKLGVGRYAFLAGVVIAILAGLFSNYAAVYAGEIFLLLVVLGIIVGLLNVGDKEAKTFLLAGIALAVGGAGMASFAALPGIGMFIAKIFGYISVFVSPAVVIVALKVLVSVIED